MSMKFFDYKAFVAKRESLLNTLNTINSNIDDCEDIDQEALEDLESILLECKDSIDFVKYASPFPLEVIANSLASLCTGDVDREEFDPIIQELLDLEENDDSWRTWTENQIVELFDNYNQDKLLEAFEILRNLCIQQNPDVEESLIPHINLEFIDEIKERGYSRNFFTESTMYLDTDVGYQIRSEEGFGGIVFGWLNLANAELSHFWNFSSYVYYSRQNTTQHVPMLTEILPQVDDTPVGPFWIAKQITNLEFYCESVHFTDSFKEKSIVHISADTLTSKASDYKSMGVITFGREIESKSAKQAERGLFFSWGRNFLCNYRFEDLSHADDIFGYGDDCIFVFSNCLISSAVSGDHNIQSVSILNSIAEAIPCKTEFLYPNWLAFIGINDKEDNSLLLVDTENYNRNTPFPCYVLDELCKYLYFQKATSDNLNSLYVPPFVEWKNYYNE